MDIVKKQLEKNKEIYYLKEKTMKSIIVWFMFYMPLDKFASENALISKILLRGCKSYITNSSIAKFLNEKYGATLGTDINLKGEVYTLGIYTNYINPNISYIKGYTSKDILTFLNEFIYNPLEENGAFSEEYFNLEKQNILNSLERKINNKEAYAFDKTIEIMCKDEAYSIDKLGKVKWIENLDNKDCYERYKKIIKESPLKIYVMGNLDENEFTGIIKDTFKFSGSKNINIRLENKEIKNVKEVNEVSDTNQGKLCIGFRTSINLLSKEFAALSVFNRLFGGGPESKLFLNLREKENICYTVYSTIEKHKGMIFVLCGIDPKNKSLAKNKILDTLEDIKSGGFTNEDLIISKTATKHSLKTVKDNKYTFISYIQGLSIYNAPYTLEELIESIELLNKDDIIEVAKTIKLDTIYFLGKDEDYES